MHLSITFYIKTTSANAINLALFGHKFASHEVCKQLTNVTTKKTKCRCNNSTNQQILNSFKNSKI